MSFVIKYIDVKDSTHDSFNTANYMFMVPFCCGPGGVLIEKDFYENDLNEAQRECLGEYKPEFTNISIYPEDFNKLKNGSELYTCYINTYDLTSPYKIQNKSIIAKITNKRIITGAKLSPDDIDELYECLPFWKEIDFSTPKMIRLSSTSNKNEKKLYPVTTHLEMFNLLTNSKKFLQTEYLIEKNTYVIVREWKNINKKYEFRVFYYRNKITGISQQNPYEIYLYKKEELEEIARAINDCITTKTIPFQTTVIDVYCENGCDIIEYNPWITSGSSLFNYTLETDRNILYSKAAPHFYVRAK